MICFSRAAVIRQVSVVSQSVRFSEKALPGSKRKLRNHRIPQKFYVLFLAFLWFIVVLFFFLNLYILFFMMLCLFDCQSIYTPGCDMDVMCMIILVTHHASSHPYHNHHHRSRHITPILRSIPFIPHHFHVIAFWPQDFVILGHVWWVQSSPLAPDGSNLRPDPNR